MLFAAGNVNGTSAAFCRLAKGPGVRLGGFFQSLGDIGGTVLGALEGIQIQQCPDRLDAAALGSQNGGVQGIVKGKAISLCLYIALEFGNVCLVFLGLLLAVKGGKAVLGGLELSLGVFQLVLYCSAAVFSRLTSLPFSAMIQFSCSSVMPGILFFTSSRFMVEKLLSVGETTVW